MAKNLGQLSTQLTNPNLKIYTNPQSKKRIWLAIRQDGSKEWNIAALRSSKKSIDILFEK